MTSNRQTTLEYITDRSTLHEGNHRTTDLRMSEPIIELVWQCKFGRPARGLAPVATCGFDGCITPEHLELQPRDTRKDALGKIVDASSYPRGGHQVCTLAEVRLGSGMVSTARAMWRLSRGDIPNTHTLHRTCDLAGCIEPNHHTLAPLKKDVCPTCKRAL